MRIFDSKNQHVFRHPAFVTRNVGCNAKGKTLFAEQRISAVTRPVRPDLAGFWEVDYVFLEIAGPRNILLARRNGRAD